MTANGWLQIAFYVAFLTAAAIPLGRYMARVYEGERVFLTRILGPVERAAYRLLGPSATAEQGRIYLTAFLPALAAMFPSAAMHSGLRATGVVRPAMIVQTLSVLLNVALAPVLVAGWGTGRPLGVLGAGLASSIAGAMTSRSDIVP